MPRNSSTGDYEDVNDSWAPAVAGTPIDPDDWNTQYADFATTFGTNSLDRTGKGGMQADLQVNGHAILATEIATPANPAATNLKVYAKSSGGVTKLATLNSAGTETIFGGSDVTGPASSTDKAIARFNGTGGNVIQNSTVTIADTTGNLVSNGTLTGTQLISNIVTGTAPLTVASTTQVANLYGARSVLADTVTIVDAAGDTTTFPMLAGSATGNLPVLTDTGLSYNSTTHALTATTFVGAFTGTATNATNIGITDDTTTNSTMYPLWVTANTGNLPAKVSSTKLSFNPSTATLTTTTFVGALTGNASTATTATNTAITDDTTTNATMYPTWVTANTGNLPQKVSSTKMSFNPSTGSLTSTTFVGALTGNASTATTSTNIGITDDTTTNATMYPLWVTANTGNLPAKVASTKLSFNPSTGVLTSTSFTGAGTGLTGTAASLTAGNVTTNANLTGVITSSGNATSIASQTGTGTKFVVDTSPTIITPTVTTSATVPLLIGGTGVSSDLIFQTTSGIGDGTDIFQWKRGNNGATVVGDLRINGLTVGSNASSPLAITSTLQYFQIGKSFSILCSPSDDVSTQFNSNVYYDGTNYKYITTAAATAFVFGQGFINCYTAPSGTAGNNATLSVTMGITNAGVNSHFKGANVASATAIAITGNVFHVTGTTNITSISANDSGGTANAAGTTITIIFDGILTFTDGNNLKLAGNFVTTADDTITLAYDGTNWYEVARSVN